MAEVDPGTQNAILCGVIALPVALGFLYVRAANRRLDRISDQFHRDCAASTAKKDDVSFTFYTFHGFFLFAVQRQHQIRGPYDAALLMLARLNRFNWTYSWFATLGPLLPFVSYWNYLGEWDRIKDQHNENHPPPLK